MSNAHPTAGSIEIINKLVINVLRSMLDELRWPTRKWAHLLFRLCGTCFAQGQGALRAGTGHPSRGPD
jgi:hypothetical protein